MAEPKPALGRASGARAIFSSASGEWTTPPDLFAELDREFRFNLDAAATEENALRTRYFTRADDALAQRWTGRVFCNPPYGRSVGSWVRKARASVESGDAEVVVMLLPARTDTAWWHDHVVHAAEVRFLRGRVRFGDAASGAPFPSAVVVFRNGRERYASGAGEQPLRGARRRAGRSGEAQ